MQIDSTVRDLLLDPLLRKELSVEIDEFELVSTDGPLSLDATLQCDRGNLRISLRDPQGRKLADLFPQGREFGSEDTTTATGNLGGQFPVRITGIWPPATSTTRPIGAGSTSSAEVLVERIEIPATGCSALSSDELAALIGADESGTDQRPAADGSTEIEHVAIFADTELKFRNTGIKRTEEHQFWGKSSEEKLISWDGDAVDGTFSLRQQGDHLKVGLRHIADAADAQKRAGALFSAIGYTHAICPWPCYVQVRENGRIIAEHLRAVWPSQGSFFPLRRRHALQDPECPTKLIASVANWLSELDDDLRKDTEHALWVFRDADNEDTPPPVQMAMIGAVIEGLFDGGSRSEVPESFKGLRNDAIAWARKIELTDENHERRGFAKRMVGYLRSWNYQDRRTQWKETFGRLFPGRDEWLDDVFTAYQAHRNPPAHGDFIAAQEPMEILRARGRLAGFVNLVIAAKAGYEGPILESPFGDAVIDLKKCED